MTIEVIIYYIRNYSINNNRKNHTIKYIPSKSKIYYYITILPHLCIVLKDVDILATHGHLDNNNSLVHFHLTDNADMIVNDSPISDRITRLSQG